MPMTERFLHYRVLSHLGSGGMGDAFLAEDQKLGRRVVLKFLSRAIVDRPEMRRRLEQEARSLAALSHPNIVTVYALEHAEGRAFLVMEYVDGETLETRIARGRLPATEVVQIGVALARALGRAHARRIVHRDVKPANVFLTHDGTAKLGDFGIARMAGATTLTVEGA